jgi:hypothetical protein
VGAYPARTVFQCVLAQLLARSRPKHEAQRIVDDLAPDDFAALPFDQEWFFGTSLSPTRRSCSATPSAPRFSTGCCVPGRQSTLRPPRGFRGAIARDLALLAALMEGWDDAERHFEEALVLNAKSRALPWLAHTQAGYARLLRTLGRNEKRADQLLAAARSTYDALGVRPEAREL